MSTLSVYTHGHLLDATRFQFRAGEIDELELSRRLSKLGYTGSLLETEIDYMKNLKGDDHGKGYS